MVHARLNTEDLRIIRLKAPIVGEASAAGIAIDPSKFTFVEEDKWPTATNEYHVLLNRDDTALCVAKVSTSPAENNIDVSYISTHAGHQRAGYAKHMIDHLGEVALAQDKLLTTRGFTETGKHMQRYLEELNARSSRTVFAAYPNY